MFMAGIAERDCDQRDGVYGAPGAAAGAVYEACVAELRSGYGGANAAEKTLALLVEEGFEVRVMTLEGGLDPDRYVREHGWRRTADAVRGATRYADYLD